MLDISVKLNTLYENRKYLTLNQSKLLIKIPVVPKYMRYTVASRPCFQTRYILKKNAITRL
jgi:hypothetical protein